MVLLKTEYMPFKFEKLIVWQKALDLTEQINDVAKNYP